jgi:ribosomal protein S18 acetylase RimI-like enzyme
MDSVTAPAETLHIEPLTADRAEELADQLLEMTRDSAWDRWGREELLSPRPGKWERSLLATRGGRPVGWAIASRSDRGTHLHHLMVAAGERSAGVGSALMRELMAGSRPGLLTLKVHPDNAAAARFYVRLGFDEQPPAPSGYRVFSCSTRDDQEPAT